jgi:predicted ATPase/class 3 adenylate cyclase
MGLPTGTVTFLFTDIQGSTKLVQSLGAEFHELLNTHHRLMRVAIGAHGGTEVSTEGDAFFVVFDSAPAAVRAAIAAQRSFAEHDWPGGAEVAVRMGLHTGEGTLSGDNYGGLDVHRAARISGAAHGGQILLSEATCALVKNAVEGVRITDLGEHRLKDIDAPERLMQVSAPGLATEFPAPRTLDARPNNLLTQLTPFVGRDREVEEICGLVGAARLVTLTGPGGTGKTRLSLEVAARALLGFDDGAFFVPLAPVVDPGLVATTVAAQLALREQGAGSIEDALMDHVRDKELLLVLDNFEQVLDAATFVSEVLRAAPRVKIVVTSRAVLHVDGEHEYPVPPMAVPDPDHLPGLEALSHYDAVELFCRRAAAAVPSFELTIDNAPAIAAICRALEGLPLALELCAARVKLLAPKEILSRLERSLEFLVGGSRDLPQRQQTLRGAIAWSYELLDEAQRKLMRRLAVFVGGWDLDAAGTVCDPNAELGGDIIELVGALADNSLIRRFESDLGESRFRMLVVIREFALAELEGSGELDALRGRHLDYFAALIERAEPEMTGQENWPDRLELELDNLRAALQHCLDSGDIETGQLMAGRSWRYWHLRGHFAEGRSWLARLLDHPNGGERTQARAKALMGRGSLDYWVGDYESTRVHYEEGLEINRELGDEAGIAEALFNLGYAAAVVRDWPTAKQRQTEAREIRERLGDRSGQAWSAIAGGLAATMTGDLVVGQDFADQAHTIFVELGDWYGQTFSEYVMFLTARETGDIERAVGYVHSFFATMHRHNDLSGIAGGLDLYADLLAKAGHHENALRLGGAAIAIKDTLGAAAPTALVDVVDPRAEARGKLTDADIDRLWAEGAALSPDEAVEFALKVDDLTPG